MKTKVLILIVALFWGVDSVSQVKLSVSSFDGTPFYLYLNGTRINNRPLTNVSVDKIPVGVHNVSLKILGIVGNVQARLDLPEANTLYDYWLMKDGNTYFLDFYGAYSEAFLKDHPDLFTIPQPVSQAGTPDNSTENKDIYININMNQTNNQTSVQNTSNGSDADTQVNNVTPPPPEPVFTGNCPHPVPVVEFNAFLKTLEEKSFDDTKMTVAKQFIRNNCVSSSQLYLILKQIDFEQSRLKLAKYAYKYVFDPGKYYLVNDAFDFSSSVEELNKYIESLESN